MNAYELDDLDKKILSILQEDGRASNVSVAREIGVGHTRVRDRILRMEEAGVIEQYRVVINPAVLLMDEPLSKLDAKLRVNMRLEIRQLTRWWRWPTLPASLTRIFEFGPEM